MTEKIVRLVISKIGQTPLDDVAKGYTIERVIEACREPLEELLHRWRTSDEENDD